VGTKSIESLIDEVRLCFHVLSRKASELHRDEPITVGMRAVLEHILRHGPTSVPQVARARGVTRQHIQELVNRLLAERLVKTEPNPAHKRSPLVALTGQGSTLIERVLSREAHDLRRLDASLVDTAIVETTQTLRKLRDILEEPT